MFSFLSRSLSIEVSALYKLGLYAHATSRHLAGTIGMQNILHTTPARKALAPFY